MRVLLVATSLDPSAQKGVARYASELFNNLKKYCDVDVLIVGSTGVAKYLEVHTILFFRLLRLVGRYDVVHAVEPILGSYLPLITRHSVVTFNDLFALSWHQRRATSSLVALYFRLTGLAAGQSARIISISSQTSLELIKYLKIPSPKIATINLGIDEKFQPLPKDQNRILTIGFFSNFGYRKRVDLAIEVFRKVRASGINCQLIIAGGNIPGTVYEKLFDVPSMIKGMDCVTILGHIDEKDIVNLYNSFDVFLFTSEIEGFGLPILEAQRCGIPVLIRKTARIPAEVTEAAIKCSGIDEMAIYVRKLLTEPIYYKEVSQDGIDYSSQFTWERVIDQTISIYRSVAGA